MSWHFSQALVEDYLQATCSDGELFAPLKSTTTREAYCWRDRMTESLDLFQFGMTSQPSTENLGAELLTWFRGGFPCVDISIAKAMWGRDGIAGEKSGLWFEYLRIIDEVQPIFVWGENSPELKAKGLADIVRALAQRGYVCRWATIGADDCGFPHKRKRLWFFASNTNKQGLEGHARHDDDAKGREDQSGQVSDVAFFDCEFCGHRMETDDRYGCPNCEGEGLDGEDCGAGILPGITGMADGVANRVDRLRAIGNGQVPKVAASAWRYLVGQ